MNNKGIVSLVAIFFILIFLALPAVFFVFLGKKNAERDIKGISTISTETPTSGVGLTVTSTKGTWELFQNLCKDLDECNSSLAAGTRIGSVGGGSVEDYKVTVSPGIQWEGNKYLKVYIKSSLGSPERVFNYVVNPMPDTEVFESEFIEDGETYKTLVFSLNYFKNNYAVLASFSDK